MLSGFQIEKCCQFHFLKVSVTVPTTQQSKMEVITRGQATLSRLYNKRKYRYLITYIFVDRVSRSLFQLRAYSTLNTPTHVSLPTFLRRAACAEASRHAGQSPAPPAA